MLPRCRPLYQKCKAFLSRWPPDWQIVRPQVPIELTRRIECHRRVGPESLRTALLVGFLARVRVATTHAIRAPVRSCAPQLPGARVLLPGVRISEAPVRVIYHETGLIIRCSLVQLLTDSWCTRRERFSLHGSRAAARTPRHGRRCSLSPPGKKPQCSCGTFTWWAWWPALPRLTL